MSREGAALPDSTRHAAPGTTSAFYMSVGQATRIRDDLMARGMPPQAPVRVAIEVSKPGEHLLTCPLGALEESLQEVGCKGCAVILVTWPEVAVTAPAVAVA